MGVTDMNPNILPRYIVFEGKNDMETKLENKLRHYLNPEACFIILRDQDRSDCKKVKNGLREICEKAGKSSQEITIRIACHELESFYLADLKAVEQALEIPKLSGRQDSEKYRDPDNKIENPAKALDKITSGKYQKVSGSEAIGAYLNLDNTRSKSFYHLIQAIRHCLSENV
jgi:hypothetical protein